MDKLLRELSIIDDNIYKIDLKLPVKRGGVKDGKKLKQESAIKNNQEIKRDLKVKRNVISNNVSLYEKKIEKLNNTFLKNRDEVPKNVNSLSLEELDDLIKRSDENVEKKILKEKAINRLIEVYKINDEDVPENINELKINEIEELTNRSIETSKPRKQPFIPNNKQQTEMIVKKYDNPYGNIDINNPAGFEFTEGSEVVVTNQVSKGFIERDYHNDDNVLAINLFIAIRFYLVEIGELASMISVRIFITYFDQIKKEQIFTEFNLSKSLIDNLKKAESAEQINDIIRSLDEDGQGSDGEISTPLINPRTFRIGYKPKNVRGGALINAPLLTRNDCTIFEHEGFICVNPPNQGNNCLIECFRFYATSKCDTSKTIRSRLGFKPNNMLTLKDIPKLESLFKLKVCVITGRDLEGKLNILYGDEKTCHFGVMYANEHFSAIRADAELLRKLEEERRQTAKEEKKRKRQELAAYWKEFKKNHPAEYKEKQKEWKENAKIKKKEEEAYLNRPRRYMFFDFETVYNEKGKLYPFALSSILYDDKWEKIDDFFHADTIGIKRTSIRERFTRYIKKHNSAEYRTIMISYNGARFDNFLLGEMLAQSGLLKGNNMQMANGAILRMRFMHYTVIDLCRFVMLPLKVACEGFKCELNKLEFDHTEVQRAQNNGELGSWIKTNYDKLKDYNDRDNVVLMQLFKKVKESINELTGQEIEKFMTISQMTYEHWRKDWGEDKVPPPLEENVKRVRQSIIAGRSQAFKKGFFDLCETLGLNSLDVKSLYPFVMMICLFPTGQEIRTEVVKEGLGIYCVRIKKQPKTKIIPNRQKDCPLNWDYEGEFVTVLTSVDIEVLKDYNAEFDYITFMEKDLADAKLEFEKASKKHKENSALYKKAKSKYQSEMRRIVEENDKTIGFYWETSDYIFKDYVEPFKNAKTQQDEWKGKGDEKYNAALREMIKLYLNSLSGKVGQREYLKDVSFCFNDNQLQTFSKTHSDIVYDEIPRMNCIKVEGTNTAYKYKKENAKPVHIAAFIYSYARSHMYRSILSKADNKFFTDTDSCHMLEEEIEKLVDEGHGFGKFHMGGEFGDFEKEIGFKVERYYSVAPKCYAMFGRFPRIEKKFKYLYDELKKCNNPRANMPFEEFFKLDSGECEKIRFKGINQRCDKILDVVEPVDETKYREKNVKLFNEKKMSDKFEEYQKLGIACCETLYKNLTNNKCVAILSSHIQRSTGGKSISEMHQTFLIKTISPIGVVNN